MLINKSTFKIASRYFKQSWRYHSYSLQRAMESTPIRDRQSLNKQNTIQGQRVVQSSRLQERKNILIQKAIFHTVPSNSQENISKHKKENKPIGDKKFKGEGQKDRKILKYCEYQQRVFFPLRFPLLKGQSIKLPDKSILNLNFSPLTYFNANSTLKTMRT